VVENISTHRQQKKHKKLNKAIPAVSGPMTGIGIAKKIPMRYAENNRSKKCVAPCCTTWSIFWKCDYKTLVHFV